MFERACAFVELPTPSTPHCLEHFRHSTRQVASNSARRASVARTELDVKPNGERAYDGEHADKERIPEVFSGHGAKISRRKYWPRAQSVDCFHGIVPRPCWGCVTPIARSVSDVTRAASKRKGNVGSREK